MRDKVKALKARIKTLQPADANLHTLQARHQSIDCFIDDSFFLDAAHVPLFWADLSAQYGMQLSRCYSQQSNLYMQFVPSPKSFIVIEFLTRSVFTVPEGLILSVNIQQADALCMSASFCDEQLFYCSFGYPKKCTYIGTHERCA